MINCGETLLKKSRSGYLMAKLLFLVLFIFNTSVFANSYVEGFDVRSYSPVKKGLKDLYFEVRNNKLKTMVESSTGVKTNDEIYFKVFWKFPDKIQVDIEGMPKGFFELENNLKKIALEVVDYVIPRSPKEVLKEFDFKESEKTNDSVTLVGTTKNSESRVSEVQLQFDKNSILKNMVTLSPYSRSETDFNMSTKKGSDNKYLTDSMETVITRGKVKLKLEKKFDYITQDGFTLPNKVQILMKPVDKTKAVENSSEMTISNYKINEGLASKRITPAKS